MFENTLSRVKFQTFAVSPRSVPEKIVKPTPTPRFFIVLPAVMFSKQLIHQNTPTVLWFSASAGFGEGSMWLL